MVFGTSEIALEDPNDGTYGVRVDLDEDAEVGSIEFALQGNEIKEFENISVTDNSPPFSLYGENDDGLLGAALPYGWVFILMATAYSEDNGGGEPLQIERATLEVSNYPASPANSPATGAPTISGTGQVGQTLTASTSGISDADGLTNVSYSYQWLADDAEISGATGGSYTLTDSEEGKAIKVKVSFTDDAGNEETLTSPPLDPARPYGLTAAVSGRMIVLTWNPPVDFPWLFDYRILRNRPELGEAEPLVHVDTGTAETTYTDTDVEPGVLYVYRVKAANYFGRLSEASEPVEIRTPESDAGCEQSRPPEQPTIGGSRAGR